MFRSIKVKIMMLSIVAVLVTALVLVFVVFSNKAPLMNKVSADFKELGRSETNKIATSVFERCKESRERKMEVVNLSMVIAREQVTNLGGASVNNGSTVQWSASNAVTGEVSTVTLPRFEIGGRWLEQITSPNEDVLLVDDINRLVGCTATVFQKMNDRGDMLRVATTQIADGRREIGSVVSATGSGGANPVISAVMSGNSYQGKADVQGVPFLTAYEPLANRNGEIIGMLGIGVEEDDKQLREWIMNLLVGKTGYVFVIGGNDPHKGHYLISKGGARDGENIWDAKDADGNAFIQDMVTTATASSQGEINYIEYPWLNEGDDAPKMKVSAVTYFEPLDWVIGAGTYYADFEDTVVAVGQRMNSLIVWTVIIAVIIVIVGGIISVLVASSIGNPLIRLAGVAEMAAAGDLTVKAPKVNTRDEVSQMADAFAIMLKNTHEAVSAVYKAAGDIAAASEELSAGADETGRAVNEVANTTGQVAAGAQDVTTNIATAQDGLRQNAQAVEGIARDIEDVAAYATEAATQGQEGRKSADEGTAVIQTAAHSVQETAQTVQSLGDKTDQIAEFIGIITGIADQTNLLALNAAIEAARAGEAGRGFAVVAEEVRKLAEESNQAAGNITSLVKAISAEMQTALTAMSKSDREVGEGAQIVEQASQVLGEIVEGVTALTDKVQAISAAAEQINANTGEVVAAMDGVAAVAEENAAAAEEISSATEEQNASMEEISASANSLASLAQDLNEMVSRFKV